MWGYGLGRAASGLEVVAGVCEYGNDYFDSNNWEFFE